MLKEFVGNVVPLGLLVASLLLYQYHLQRTTELRLSGLEATLNSQQIRDATSVFGPYDIGVVEVLPNYETFVRAIEREIVGTKRKFHVLRIQSQQSSPTGEAKYFEETMRRLKKGEIPDYRRLVRAPSSIHIKLYENLLDGLKDAPTFQMKLWTAQDAPVNFDMVISDDAAILVFGNNPGQGVPAWGICLKGKEMSDRLDTIFEHLWNKNSSVVLKEAKPLDDDTLRVSKELLKNQQLAAK
ncbi:MAG TPA: hypothetical protein VJ842_12575 [Pyrinomonadaceae bacterium]|nr:hypothetical protein [Pyrinomonadaceae bacterium]